MRALKLAAALSLLSLLGGCARHQAAPDVLAEIRTRGELRVVTLNLPTCYYLGAQGTEGLEYELASAYAEHLGVRLNMYPLANEGELQVELAAGRADLAAASLSGSPEWARSADAAEPYTLIPQLVVYQRDGVRPRDTLQLESATLAVRAGTPQERILQRLKNTVAPTLRWEETAPTSADPVEDVDSGTAQYAITDEREFSFAHHLYPNVLVGFTLPEQRPVGWMVRKNAPQLLASVNAFFAQLAASGRLAQLVQESSGDTRRFEYEESREFQGNVADRLPPFRPMFEEAAAQSGIDWRLLAAIGYQESKWDPKAASGDGAVGVMMLTADTAQAMGDQGSHRSAAEHQRRRALPRRGARQGAGPRPGTRPHVAHDRCLQRRLRAPGRRAYPRAVARQESGLVDRRALAAAPARAGALVRPHEARLCARLGAGAVRRSHPALSAAARMAARGIRQRRTHPDGRHARRARR